MKNAAATSMNVSHVGAGLKLTTCAGLKLTRRFSRERTPRLNRLVNFNPAQVVSFNPAPTCDTSMLVAAALFIVFSLGRAWLGLFHLFFVYIVVYILTTILPAAW